MDLKSLTFTARPEDTLYFYDGPLAFFERDRSGQLWLMWCIDEDNGSMLFLSYAIDSRSEFEDMLLCNDDLRSSLIRPCLLSRWSAGGVLVEFHEHTFTPEFIEEYLPESGVFYTR